MAMENPTRGYTRIQGALQNVGHRVADCSDVDVVVGRWTWEAVVDCAERMGIAGLEIPVARTSDPIMLKLAVGGHTLRVVDTSGGE